jgi:hypothetical protein
MLRPLPWVLGLAFLFVAAAVYAEDRRNPFDVEDVNDPVGEDVKQFASGVTLDGGKDDKNAEQWVTDETNGKAGSLDGDWSGRWSADSGKAQIKVKKDRVFILYEDNKGKWLIECEKSGKKLVGRWVNVANACESGPFAGLIVDDERIDGQWAENERWDFRRKLKK